MRRSIIEHKDSPSAADAAAARQLAANDFVYRRLRREVGRLYARRDPKLLPFIEGTARFAWWSHPGRLADGALENPLLEIGQTLADTPFAVSQMPDIPASASRTLHVASQVYATGGHSRILAKWVQRDLASSHAIVLTRHAGTIPDFLTSVAVERQAPVVTLDRSESILDRARQLRALSREFDRVILHHHPDDAVPTLAFASPGGCPVAMFNHAHFWFSLGSGVADTIINTTPYFRQLTRDQRFPRTTDQLYGPPGLERMRWSDIDKRRAKEKLGLHPDRPVAMTIGYEAYFTPSGGVDFFATLAKLLAAHPDLQMLVVGVPEDSALVPASIRETGQVRLFGPVPNPRPYYEAADLCLESFPMPSLGALIEAPAYGEAFPVPAFAETESPTIVDQPQITDFVVRQRSEKDYLRYIGDLLEAREATRFQARLLRQSIIRQDEDFGSQFASLYDRLEHLGHAAHEIPVTNHFAAPANLVLASLTDNSDFQNALGTLPLLGMAESHVRAVIMGYETSRTAAACVAKRLGRPIVRHLPGVLQSWLRPEGALPA